MGTDEKPLQLKETNENKLYSWGEGRTQTFSDFSQAQTFRDFYWGVSQDHWEISTPKTESGSEQREPSPAP